MAEADLCERRTVKGRAKMNEENEERGQSASPLIDYRLTQIEKKLDTVTDLLLKTQAQEMRITTLETMNTELKTEIENIKTQKTKNTDRWLNPLISAVVSVFVAFIAIKVGLK